VRQHGCQSHLVVRGHRALLPHADRLALDAHLTECAPCRLDQQIFADFNDEDAVDIRDGARIEGLANVARTWAMARQPRAKRHWPLSHRMWAVAAALLLLAGAAGATTWWTRRSVATTPAKPGTSPAAIVTGRPAGELGTGMPVSVAAAPALVPLSTGPSQNPRPLDHAPHELRAAREAGGSDAALLLRLAGNARRGGNRTRAVEIYRKLQHDFPGSPEALLSTVPVSNLQLEQGVPRAALAGFDRYLRAAPAGVLVPEALYGRARALAALGDHAQEQSTWQRLLRDFPTSAYAPLARRRATLEP
jgi:tetratricopeptide (TPR) repeat protein